MRIKAKFRKLLAMGVCISMFLSSALVTNAAYGSNSPAYSGGGSIGVGSFSCSNTTLTMTRGDSKVIAAPTLSLNSWSGDTDYEYDNVVEYSFSKTVVDENGNNYREFETRVDKGLNFYADPNSSATTITITFTLDGYEAKVKKTDGSNDIEWYSGNGGDTAVVTINFVDAPAPTPAPAEEKKEEAPKKSEPTPEPVVEKKNDTVQMAGGKSVTSTVGGVYSASGVAGTAVITPKAAIQLAIGVTEPGTNISFYVCDTKPAKNPALNDAVGASGKKVATFLRADMYAISKDGKVSPVRSSSELVTLLFGVPSGLRSNGNSFSIICIDKEGKTVVFEDTDSDPNTITINANVFGAYAVVY